MHKVIAITLLALSGVCHADNSLLVGDWKCKMTSEYIDADQEFTVNQDKTYKLVAKVFGSDLIDIGKWNLNDKELHLNKEIHIAGGKKESSNHKSIHKITKLEKNNLVFTIGKGISTCSK